MEQTVESATRYPSTLVDPSTANEARASGVSWAAVIGGAFVAAALSLILLALGAGLGFSTVSIWSNVGASASTIGMAAIVWLIVMQIISSSMGGYLAGRLRTKWAHVHTDEVYFRDTAHGFLAWAVAFVITAAFLGSAAAALAGSATSLPARGSGAGVEADGRELDPNSYFVDMLFALPLHSLRRTLLQWGLKVAGFLRMRFGRKRFLQPTGAISLSWLPPGQDSTKPMPRSASPTFSHRLSRRPRRHAKQWRIRYCGLLLPF